MLLLLFAFHSPAAEANSGAEPLQRLVTDSTLIVEGTVLSVDECLNATADRAWTFVTLSVSQIHRGSLQTPETITIRIPGGAYPDGTVSTLSGTPRFFSGQELFALLHFNPDGEAGFFPFVSNRSGVLEILETSTGIRFVVDAEGRPVLYGEGDESSFGPAVSGLSNRLLLDTVRDQAAITNGLQTVNSWNGWDGSGVPTGTWTGVVSIDLTEVEGPATGTCVARLSGDYDGTLLNVAGRCNADHAGAVTIEMTGEHENGTWTGLVSATADIAPDETRSIPWTHDTPDLTEFRVIASEGFSEYETAVATDLTFGLSYAGPVRLATVAETRASISYYSSSDLASAGLGLSTELAYATCNTSVVLTPVGQTTGANQ